MRTKEDGFTLLEALIAVIILAGGISALVWAFCIGTASLVYTEDLGLALNIAQAKMETVKNTPFASLADSGPTQDPVFTKYNVTVNVAELQNPMQVAVTVAWSVKGGTDSITLTTLVANYG